MKHRIYTLLNENRIFIKFISLLIVLNVISLIFESYREFRESFGLLLYYFEFFSVVIFTIEYVLRFWSADLNPKYTGNSFMKRLKFTFSTLGLVDLFAILPFYLPFLIAIDLRVLRILRLLRLLRIFKLGRYSKSFKIISSVLKETRSELGITFFVAFVLLVLSSTLMYYIERDVQPEAFASIGHAFWWAVATLTTVGYGDVYPVTGIGKVLSALIAIIGIGFVALPTGIISSVFIEKVQEGNSTKHQNNQECTCPNCGTVFKNE